MNFLEKNFFELFGLRCAPKCISANKYRGETRLEGAKNKPQKKSRTPVALFSQFWYNTRV